MNKEKFIQKDREPFSGVSIDFLENLEAENEEEQDDLNELVDNLEGRLISYAKEVKNLDKAIEVSRFKFDDREKFKKVMEGYDKGRRDRHNTIIDLLNGICRLSKEDERKWRESWGTIGTDFERENIHKWALSAAENLEVRKN